jgi:gamma-glutamyltranspeptidase/glutathione hydrolase
VQAIVAVRIVLRGRLADLGRDVAAGGRVPRPLESFANPVLAATYERICVEAARAGGGRVAEIDAAIASWYRGFVGTLIDGFYANQRLRDTTGERNGGLLRYDDLAGWEARYDEPATLRVRALHGGEVRRMEPGARAPASSSRCCATPSSSSSIPVSALWVHRVTEAAKLAFADRLAWYGDPDSSPSRSGTALGSLWRLALGRGGHRVGQGAGAGAPGTARR